MNGCETYMELISQCLDGELSEPQKTELEAHLAICPDCRRVYNAFASVSFAISEEAEPPESLRSGVMDAIREDNAVPPAAKARGFGWGRLGALAACLAIVIFTATKANVLFRGAGAPAPASVSAVSNDLSGEARISAEGASTTPVEDNENAPNLQTGLWKAEDAEPAPAETPRTGANSVLPPALDEVLSTYENSAPSNYDYYVSNAREELASGGDLRVTSGSDTTVALMDVSVVTLFAGEDAGAHEAEREPIAILSDEESILLIMDMLEFSEEGGEELTVTGEPLFVVDVTCRDAKESYTLSVWVVEGRLCCVSSLDDKLFVAAGDIGDIIEFILKA